MKIAVTFDKENGNVFQHFGHTENFKFYEIQDNQIKSSEVINTNGQGHGALGGFLKDNGTEILICGGIGSGAQNALTEAGIKFFAGVTGSADEAVKNYLAGKLEFNPEPHCDHDHEHEHHGHDCGHHSCEK